MSNEPYDASKLLPRLYKWFYFLDKMPTKLCPYAWKTAFMYVVLMPYSIICLPVIIIDSFGGDVYTDSHGGRIGSSIIMYFFLFMVFVLSIGISILWWNPEYDSFFENIQHGGAFLWIVGILAGIIYFFKCIIEIIKEKLDERKYGKINEGIYYQKKPTKKYMLVEFIKAKYNRYCPEMIWKNED